MICGLINCHNRLDDAACLAFKLKSTEATLVGRAAAGASTQQCVIDFRVATTSGSGRGYSADRENR
jgi:hypothetical protein